MEQNVQNTPACAGGCSKATKIGVAIAAVALVVAVCAFILHMQAKKELAVQNGLRLNARIKLITEAVEMYRAQNSKLPASLDELVKYKTSSGKALYEDPVYDTWKTPLIYKVEGDKFSVFSAGPDAKEGTADDVHLGK
ncbi:MAG: type II secretion system protein GspG [Planctomycetes bacterium]|nr:type II secretion system protein GspG [Planctomycetota bacterium]